MKYHCTNCGWSEHRPQLMTGLVCPNCQTIMDIDETLIIFDLEDERYLREEKIIDPKVEDLPF